MVISGLDNIKGIGPKTREILLKHFDSVEAIREADTKSLENLIGKARAAVLIQSLRPGEKTS
ncbi:MAG TPA: helix-hairpin-helix domain-containing protein [Bacteroidales bacterium]|nr:helix-hairpin-helix domain-containing protein [Bacteroidales bacterium]